VWTVIINLVVADGTCLSVFNMMQDNWKKHTKKIDRKSTVSAELRVTGPEVLTVRRDVTPCSPVISALRN
jgi:hypothetical protein